METIQAILESRLLAAVGDSGGVPVTVQAAQDTRFGDYQSNIAMQLAKPRRANPRAIAQEIIDRLDVAGISEKPEIAGAGFINFRITPAALAGYQMNGSIMGQVTGRHPLKALAEDFVPSVALEPRSR